MTKSRWAASKLQVIATIATVFHADPERLASATRDCLGYRARWPRFVAGCTRNGEARTGFRGPFSRRADELAGSPAATVSHARSIGRSRHCREHRAGPFLLLRPSGPAIDRERRVGREYGWRRDIWYVTLRAQRSRFTSWVRIRLIGGYGTGMVFTCRTGALGGVGVLAVVLPLTIWYNGAARGGGRRRVRLPGARPVVAEARLGGGPPALRPMRERQIPTQRGRQGIERAGTAAPRVLT
jgi:hypothetical protein